MNSRLIRANVALFKEQWSEVQHWLNLYIDEHTDPERARREPMVMWLDAHVQSSPEERIHRLRRLVETVASSDKYRQMAKAYLAEEDTYRARAQGLLSRLRRAVRSNRHD